MSNDTNQTIFTIGHGTREYEELKKRLIVQGVDHVVDVRSVPWSRSCPHFRSEELNKLLAEDNIQYTFMGSWLGGRPKIPSVLRNGKVCYELQRETADFKAGIQWLKNRVGEGHRIALLCLENNPMACHRALLVGNELFKHSKNIAVFHLVGEGDIPLAPDAQAVGWISHTNLRAIIKQVWNDRLEALGAPTKNRTGMAVYMQGRHVCGRPITRKQSETPQIPGINGDPEQPSAVAAAV